MVVISSQMNVGDVRLSLLQGRGETFGAAKTKFPLFGVRTSFTFLLSPH